MKVSQYGNYSSADHFTTELPEVQRTGSTTLRRNIKVMVHLLRLREPNRWREGIWNTISREGQTLSQNCEVGFISYCLW